MSGLEDTGITLVGSVSSIIIAMLAVFGWRIHKLEKCLERIECSMIEEKKRMVEVFDRMLENDMDSEGRISKIEGRMGVNRE